MRNFCYAVIGVLFFLIGCNVSDLDFDNLKVENLRSDIAVPFGTASYAFEELLRDLDSENMEILEDNSIIFRYYDTVEYDFSLDLFDIPDNDETTTLNLPNAADGSGAYSELLPFTQTYESQEVNRGESLDSVFHSAGAMVRVTVSSTSSMVPMDYSIDITSTRRISDNSAIRLTGTVNSGFVDEDLDGYVTRLTDNGGQNEINAEITITANLGAGESFNADQIMVRLEFVSQSFHVVFGQMGQDTVDFTSQTLDIPFFEDLGKDGIEFGGATMNFNITSTFGIPIGLRLAGVYGEENDGTRTYLAGSAVGNPPVILPAMLDENTYDPIETETPIEINAQNSTFGQLLGTSPSSLTFDVQGVTNPYDATASNFIHETGTIDANIQIDIPLQVSLKDVTQTIDFDIPGGVELTEVDSMELRLVTVNELPFNATLDMYILGDTLNTGVNDTDTLFQVLDKSALDQPFLNIDRTVREPKIAVEDIPLGEKGTKELARAEVIRVVLTMNSPETQTSQEIYVKLLSTAKLEITLGVRGIIDVKL